MDPTIIYPDLTPSDAYHAYRLYRSGDMHAYRNFLARCTQPSKPALPTSRANTGRSAQADRTLAKLPKVGFEVTEKKK